MQAVGFCLERRHLRRSITTAAVVGTVLSLINQADVIIEPGTPGATWVKVALNYVVPFVVTNVGILAGRPGAGRPGTEAGSPAERDG